MWAVRAMRPAWAAWVARVRLWSGCCACCCTTLAGLRTSPAMWKARRLSLRPAGSPGASLSARARLGHAPSFYQAPARLGQPGAWAALVSPAIQALFSTQVTTLVGAKDLVGKYGSLAVIAAGH
eukprot:scaffold125141_cov42-Phaeocystis_antarctica.AAC.1